MVVVVDCRGQARCLYTENVDLAQLGVLSIERASHVEPDRRGRWWADLGPVFGPRLGPFPQRSQALALEARWLEQHRLAFPSPSTGRLAMGLTVHYRLKTHLERQDDVRFALTRMREAALKLPFKEVGNLVEFTGAATTYDRDDDDYSWLKIQAGAHVQSDTGFLQVRPSHIIAFETWPERLRASQFGLCRYPAPSSTRSRPPSLDRHQPDRLAQESFCKTQYASDPACGGVENFVRCHLLVIQMLDLFAKAGWFEVDVTDESRHWADRDPRRLAQTVGEWNELVAAVVGQVKDAGEHVDLQAPIARFPDFEHLEAKGEDRLKN